VPHLKNPIGIAWYEQVIGKKIVLSMVLEQLIIYQMIGVSGLDGANEPEAAGRAAEVRVGLDAVAQPPQACARIRRRLRREGTPTAHERNCKSICNQHLFLSFLNGVKVGLIYNYDNCNVVPMGLPLAPPTCFKQISSLSTNHNEGLCPSSGNINRLMMMKQI
jgi:hypothetical protein